MWEFPHRIVLKCLLALLSANAFLESYYPVQLSTDEFPKNKCLTCDLFRRNGIHD